MSKTEKWLLAYIIVAGIAIYYYKKSNSLDAQLVKTKTELQESEDREYGIEAENNRLIARLRDYESKQDELDECRSDNTFKSLDLDQCKRELDIAVRYGAKCMKQNLSLLEQLRRRK